MGRFGGVDARGSTRRTAPRALRETRARAKHFYFHAGPAISQPFHRITQVKNPQTGADVNVIVPAGVMAGGQFLVPMKPAGDENI